MPLEDPKRIDIVSRSQKGKPCLVITDSGLTTEPDARFAMLLEKVTHYLDYILSVDFKRVYPGLKPGDVRILVICATGPTDKMTRFTRLTNPEDETEWIEIDYELFEGSLPASKTVPDGMTAVPEMDSKPQFKRSISQWIWVFVCIGLLGSGVYRLVVLKQSPLTPLLILFILWRLRIYRGRRRWEKMKSDMIAGRVDPRALSK